MGAVAWALLVETVWWLSPSAAFFGLTLNDRFLFLTTTAPAVFGVVLGCYRRCVRMVAASE